jgi:hypothetical protein
VGVNFLFSILLPSRFEFVNRIGVYGWNMCSHFVQWSHKMLKFNSLPLQGYAICECKSVGRKYVLSSLILIVNWFVYEQYVLRFTNLHQLQITQKKRNYAFGRKEWFLALSHLNCQLLLCFCETCWVIVDNCDKIWGWFSMNKVQKIAIKFEVDSVWIKCRLLSMELPYKKSCWFRQCVMV